ncbi:hypothetical protein PICSAR7_04402 [Mycobacterium avium subsp. paratuberculosis]|nr:hypothetical protein PICSAR7_04402 [Mycobacterium avium subsp. paratuberculosis]
MAFREAEIGERLQLFVGPVDHLVGGAVQRPHAVVEPAAQPSHPLGGALGPHGAAQLIGLGGGEPGAVHRELHQLLLKQRHPQRLSQRRLHRRVVVEYRVHPIAPPDVGMHRPALDGPGTDQRHLHHQVVEHPGLQPRQGGHLRARLHLEHADGIGAGQHLVHRRLGQVEPRQVHLDPLVLGHQVDGVVQRREHAQPEQVELHQTDCRAVVFVPLQHAAILHPGPLHRAHVGDRAVADHHAAGVNAQVSRQVADLVGQVDHLRRDAFHVRGIRRPAPAADLLAPRVLLTLRIAQRAGHVAHRDLSPVGDDVGDLGGVVAAVAVVDVLDHLFALVGFDVHVDVGRAVAGRRQEALEQQLVGHRVHRGDAQGVADRGVGRRSPTLAQDVVLPAEPGDVVHHQEISRKLQLRNDFQLVLDLGVGPRRVLG